MFVINDITDDLVSSCMKLVSLKYNEVSLIYFDEDTQLLNYIFTDKNQNYAKLKTKKLEINISISSVFPQASFLEKKLTYFEGIVFEEQDEQSFKANHCFEYKDIKVKSVLKDGAFLKSQFEFEYLFRRSKYISFDSLLESFSEFENHSYIYQLMGLFAFENGCSISEPIIATRMLLIELDKIKYFASQLQLYTGECELSENSLFETVKKFIETNLLKKNLLDTKSELFSDGIIKSYKVFSDEVKREMKKQRNLFNDFFNKMELKSFVHPACIYSDLIHGPLSRSTGEKIDFNYKNKDLYFYQFSSLEPQSNDKSSYSYYGQLFFEIEKSLDVCFEILESKNFSREVFEDYSFYDLNNLNSDSCYQIENGHGLATLSIYKDSTNKLIFQLIPESLRRLFYFENNFDKYDFAMQKKLINSLEINYSEIF